MTRKVLRNVGVPLLSIVIAPARLAGHRRLGLHVASYVAPRPMAAIRAVTENWSTLWPLILGTLRETIVGFVVGALVGSDARVFMAKVPVVNRMIYPVLVLSQAVPIIALGPPLVLILGFGVTPKVAHRRLDRLLPRHGERHRRPEPRRRGPAPASPGSTARRAGARSVQIEVPAASTSLFFSGLKIGATYAMTGAIIGELASSERGRVPGPLPAQREFELQHRRRLRDDDADDGHRHRVVPADARGRRSLVDAVAAANGRAPVAPDALTTSRVAPAPVGSSSPRAGESVMKSVPRGAALVRHA